MNLTTTLKQIQVNLGLGTWSVIDRTTGKQFPARPGVWGELKPNLPLAPYGVLGERANRGVNAEVSLVLRTETAERQVLLSRDQANKLRERLSEQVETLGFITDLPEDFPLELIE